MNSQEEFDKVFLGLSVNSVIEDIDSAVDEIISYEAQARNAVAYDEDPAPYAQQAYEVFLSVPMKTVPTLIMAIADRFNREREAFLALLDVVDEARVKLGAVSSSDLSYVQALQLVDVLEMLKKGIEDSPYSRKEASE